MESDCKSYLTFIKILEEELIPAMGCTEPIAIAYASSKAREVLESIPERVIVEVSGNIIKNVKSVIIPNTNGLKGIKAACSAGIIAGESKKLLEVISEVTDEEKFEIKNYLSNCDIIVKETNSNELFDIVITVFNKNSYAKVRIIKSHTNIVLIEKDEVILFESSLNDNNNISTDRSLLNVKNILDFTNTVQIEDIESIIARQIDYNSAIAEKGLHENFASNIGKTLLENDGDTLKNRLKAYTAAGSDARMGGCELPVVIVAGSGNQGLTASLPVIKYANEKNISREKLIRALVLSNLLTIYQKSGIGKLSAYCGAVSAGSASGAAISYLSGGDLKDIENVLVNSLAITSGIICDGAKASCAAKIASAVDAGMLGYYMNEKENNFSCDDGIIGDDAEDTIKNVCRLAKEGMKDTDKEIIKIMIGE